MTSSFKDLSEGEYEVVFPIYWQQDAPDLLAHSLSFSWKRTKITDTVHFSFTVKKSEPNVEDNNVTNTDKTITKESKVKSPYTGDSFTTIFYIIMVFASTITAYILIKNRKYNM
ncbi:hypothetical protein ACGCUQ_01780 [Eubacteriales bacterium KG127]